MTPMVWMIVDGKSTPEDLGFIPSFLDPDDPRSAREQLDANYQHGGGWDPRPKFTLNKDGSLSYPGDPDMYPIALTTLHDVTVIVYPYSWVVLMQKDRSFEIARLD